MGRRNLKTVRTPLQVGRQGQVMRAVTGHSYPELRLHPARRPGCPHCLPGDVAKGSCGPPRNSVPQDPWGHCTPNHSPSSHQRRGAGRRSRVLWAWPGHPHSWARP